MSSAKLIYYLAQSLDGYITDNKESVEWLETFGSPDEDFGYNSFYDSIDSLVMGSNTYKFIERYGKWPYPGKPSWILSQNTHKKLNQDIQVTPQSPYKVINQIRKEGYQKTWLVGGAKLAKSFLEINAITEFIITVIPVLLGGGLPLLADLSQRVNLEMSNQIVYDSGVVQLSYKPAAD